MYGQFLFPIAVTAVVVLARALWQGRRTMTIERVLATLIVGLTAVGLQIVLGSYFEVRIAPLVVALGLASATLLVLPGVGIRQRLLWFWVGTAMALSALVEAVVLKGDIGRMNTVFKFHLQVWMLLAVAGAVFLEQLLHSTNALAVLFNGRWQVRSALPPDVPNPPEGAAVASHPLARTLSDAAAVAAALLVLCAGLYPAFAIPAKVRDRWVPTAPRTLDGMAYMQWAVQYERGAEIRTAADYRVIRWMQENIEGSPTIMEAQADREYLWGGRISIYTGLPSVAAWRWHQVQQRMVMPAWYCGGSAARCAELLLNGGRRSSPRDPREV